jgi:NADPH-dependent ferric siderophore reductase
MAIPCSPARVHAAVRLTPHLVRITLETIGDWVWHVDGIGDERVDIAIPREGETVADIDTFNLPEYGPGWVGEEPPWRHYTVRRVRDQGRRFDIDFVVHGHGIASSWADRAEPGHIVGVFTHDHPHSYYSPPRDAPVQLLVADATGLPGLARICEQLDEGIRVTAIVEVPSADGLGPSRLAEAVSEIDAPSEPWYAWVACEASESRAIRRELRQRLGLGRDRHHAIGYWVAGASGDMPADVDG